MAAHKRQSARAIVLDDEGRVLLLRVIDPETVNPPVWVTPGGGVEDGEDVATAASRELQEETGLVRTPQELGDPVAVCRGEWTFRDTDLYSEDWYFLVRTPLFDLDNSGWTELEQQLHVDWKWWTCEELDAPHEIVFPAGLADLARGLFEGAHTSEPVELPWTRI